MSRSKNVARFARSELLGMSVKELKKLLPAGDPYKPTDKIDFCDHLVQSGAVDLVVEKPPKAPPKVDRSPPKVTPKVVPKVDRSAPKVDRPKMDRQPVELTRRQIMHEMSAKQLKQCMNEAGVFFDTRQVADKEGMLQVFMDSGMLRLLPDEEEETEEAVDPVKVKQVQQPKGNTSKGDRKPVELSRRQIMHEMSAKQLKQCMNEAGVFFDTRQVADKEGMIQVFMDSGMLRLLPDSSDEEEETKEAVDPVKVKQAQQPKVDKPEGDRDGPKVELSKRQMMKEMSVRELKQCMNEEAGVFFVARQVRDKEGMVDTFLDSGKLRLLPDPADEDGERIEAVDPVKVEQQQKQEQEPQQQQQEEEIMNVVDPVEAEQQQQRSFQFPEPNHSDQGLPSQQLLLKSEEEDPKAHVSSTSAPPLFSSVSSMVSADAPSEGAHEEDEVVRESFSVHSGSQGERQRGQIDPAEDEQQQQQQLSQCTTSEPDHFNRESPSQRSFKTEEEDPKAHTSSTNNTPPRFSSTSSMKSVDAPSQGSHDDEDIIREVFSVNSGSQGRGQRGRMDPAEVKQQRQPSQSTASEPDHFNRESPSQRSFKSDKADPKPHIISSTNNTPPRYSSTSSMKSVQSVDAPSQGSEEDDDMMREGSQGVGGQRERMDAPATDRDSDDEDSIRETQLPPHLINTDRNRGKPGPPPSTVSQRGMDAPGTERDSDDEDQIQEVKQFPSSSNGESRRQPLSESSRQQLQPRKDEANEVVETDEDIVEKVVEDVGHPRRDEAKEVVESDEETPEEVAESDEEDEDKMGKVVEDVCHPRRDEAKEVVESDEETPEEVAESDEEISFEVIDEDVDQPQRDEAKEASENDDEVLEENASQQRRDKAKHVSKNDEELQEEVIEDVDQPRRDKAPEVSENNDEEVLEENASLQRRDKAKDVSENDDDVLEEVFEDVGQPRRDEANEVSENDEEVLEENIEQVSRPRTDEAKEVSENDEETLEDDEVIVRVSQPQRDEKKEVTFAENNEEIIIENYFIEDDGQSQREEGKETAFAKNNEEKHEDDNEEEFYEEIHEEYIEEEYIEEEHEASEDEAELAKQHVTETMPQHKKKLPSSTRADPPGTEGEDEGDDLMREDDLNLSRIESPEKLKQKGNSALLAGNTVDAIELYTQALQHAENCKNIHVYYCNRSAAFLEYGDARAALSDADSCLEVQPDDFSKGFSRKGAALLALKRYQDAIAVYEDGLEKFPNDLLLKKGLQKAKSEAERSRERLMELLE